MTNHTKQEPSSQHQTILFCALFIIGCLYILVFYFFYSNSINFIQSRQAKAAMKWAQSNQLTLPAVIKFTNHSPWVQGLGSDWNAPEDWGVWSKTATAKLVLPSIADPALHSVCLTFWLGAITSATRKQWPLKIAIDGRQFQTSNSYFGYGPHKIEGQASIDEGLLHISLTGPAPVSPHALNGSPDHRLLSLALTKILITSHCASPAQ